MVVDLSIYTGLLWLTTGLPATLYVSMAMAIVVAMTWNFRLNRRLTFSFIRSGNLIRQYLRFAAACSVGAVVNWSLAVGLVKIVPFFFQHVLTAAVLGIAAGTFPNFFMSRHWAFAKPTAAVNREVPI